MKPGWLSPACARVSQTPSSEGSSLPQPSRRRLIEKQGRRWTRRHRITPLEPTPDLLKSGHRPNCRSDFDARRGTDGAQIPGTTRLQEDNSRLTSALGTADTVI